MWVVRSCKPPWSLIIFSIIHEVAEPHTMSIISFRVEAHVFQKWPKARTKPDLGVSKQGSSSIYMTSLSLWGFLSKVILSASKASSHVLGWRPEYPIPIKAVVNAKSSSSREPSMMPVAVKANLLLKNCCLAYSATAIHRYKFRLP